MTTHGQEGEKVKLTVQGKNKKDYAKQKGKGKIPTQPNIKKESKCFFRKKKGHMKKDCPNFKISLDKKGTQLSFVCCESNTTDVNHNTWWIDFGSSIYVTNSMQGSQDLRKLVGGEQDIYS